MQPLQGGRPPLTGRQCGGLLLASLDGRLQRLDLRVERLGGAGWIEE